ncbi:hypothetical protein MKX54_01760 [Alkalihalobacillus sp. FSL R5-0424]
MTILLAIAYCALNCSLSLGWSPVPLGVGALLLGSRGFDLAIQVGFLLTSARFLLSAPVS